MAADYSAEEIAQWARGLVRMLVFAICTDSILLGMTVRLAVTYARTFTRDPPLYRILVSLCLALSAGHTAAICAYLFNFISMTVIDISGERGLQTNTYITGRTFTAAAMCVAEAFFIARLFDVTRNLFVRCTAIVLWVTSTGLMIWWSVERTKNQRLYPIIRGKLGIAGIVTECLLLLTAALVAFFLMRELPRVRPPEELPKTRRQKFLYYSTLFIESSGLLAFDHLISVIHRFFALRYPTASLLTNYFYYLFPSISVFSVAFAINQRPPPPLPPAGTTGTCSKLGGTTSFNPPAMGGGEDIEQMQQEEQKRSFLAASASRGGGSEMIASTSAATYGLNSFLGVGGQGGGGGGGSIIYDPDDPQTWRGDAQRVVPSIVRFDDIESGSFIGIGSGGGSGGGGEELSLAPRTYRPTPTSGKSLKGSAQSVKSSRGAGSVSPGGGGGGERPGFGAAGGNSREGRSFLSVGGGGGGGGGGSIGRVEYDEDLVDMDSTVVSLDLGAFAAVRETASSWGPKRVKDEEEEHLEAPSTPTTGSTNSTPDPNL